MFMNYLYRVGFNPKTMNKVQLNEMKKAHYAAISSAIAALMTKKTQKGMSNMMDKWLMDVNFFWSVETAKRKNS